MGIFEKRTPLRQVNSPGLQHSTTYNTRVLLISWAFHVVRLDLDNSKREGATILHIGHFRISKDRKLPNYHVKPRVERKLEFYSST